jgi:hypothetical protein
MTLSAGVKPLFLPLRTARRTRTVIAAAASSTVAVQGVRVRAGAPLD